MYLRSEQVMTDGAGYASFSANLSGSVALGEGITATATDAEGNSSEFSNCVTHLATESEYRILLPILVRGQKAHPM
jgi:hypothetical protein